MVRPIKRDKKKYKNNRWYVLLVTDSGRTIPIRHFKGMIWAVVFFGAALLALMGVLFFLYIGSVDEKTALERTVASRERENAALQKEKDSMMAKLAIAESNLKISTGSLEKGDMTAAANRSEVPGEPVVSITARVTKTPQENTSPENEVDMPAAGPITEPAEISVENFMVCYDPDAGRMNVEFKVINIGEKKQPVSGYAYTILKDGKEEKDRWLIFPETQLLNGMPVQTRGMRFHIYNFRTMKFSVKHDDPNQYTFATVFVYRQDNGQLMLERDFEMDMIPTCP